MAFSGLVAQVQELHTLSVIARHPSSDEAERTQTSNLFGLEHLKPRMCLKICLFK